MTSNYLLRYSVLLFAVNVHFARGDLLYHTACIVLTCSSIIRHYCAYVTPAIALVDRVVAHLCYALCMHTHLIEAPNTAGAIYLALVLGLWIYEHRISDWARAHVVLHIVAFLGILRATVVRVQPITVTDM